MNETAKPRFSLTLLLPMALLAACSAGPAEDPPLKGARVGGPFTLTNQEGRRVSDSEFAGRYRLIYFGFTFCPDVCPVDLQQIGLALRQFEKSDAGRAAKVQPIFISVDPERDRPAVLKQYVSAFHPRLIGLTGSPEELAEVARRYAVYYGKQPLEGEGGYGMDHSRVALLFGPKGEPIVILPHEEGAAAIAAELDRWVE